MNKKTILKHTADYDEYLFKKLSSPKFAQIYLETAIEDYEEDGNTKAFLLAMKHERCCTSPRGYR